MSRLGLWFRLYVLCPLSFSSKARREKRGRFCADYLRKYLPESGFVPSSGTICEDGDEKVYSIWLQGLDQAPELVKSCWRSIRRHIPAELVILDEKAALELPLPDYIIRKYKEGKIRPAHFADICRVELLYRYGGYWMDATCFVTSDVHQYVKDADFFMYLTLDHPAIGYSFVQNCFIRARKGAYLLEAWRYMIHEYWKHENHPVNYFVHQLLFRSLVENDRRAAEEFESMPQILQIETHRLWWDWADKPYNEDIFKTITSGSFFQKTAFKSKSAQNPVSGSFADVMMKM